MYVYMILICAPLQWPNSRKQIVFFISCTSIQMHWALCSSSKMMGFWLPLLTFYSPTYLKISQYFLFIYNVYPLCSTVEPLKRKLPMVLTCTNPCGRSTIHDLNKWHKYTIWRLKVAVQFLKYRGPSDLCGVVGHDGWSHWIISVGSAFNQAANRMKS